MYYHSRHVTPTMAEAAVLQPGRDFNTAAAIDEVEHLLDEDIRQHLDDEGVALLIRENENLPHWLIGQRRGTAKMVLADGTSVIFLDRKTLGQMDLNRTLRHELSIK